MYRERASSSVLGSLEPSQRFVQPGVSDPAGVGAAARWIAQEQYSHQRHVKITSEGESLLGPLRSPDMERLSAPAAILFAAYKPHLTARSQEET